MKEWVLVKKDDPNDYLLDLEIFNTSIGYVSNL